MGEASFRILRRERKREARLNARRAQWALLEAAADLRDEYVPTWNHGRRRDRVDRDIWPEEDPMFENVVRELEDGR